MKEKKGYIHSKTNPKRKIHIRQDSVRIEPIKIRERKNQIKRGKFFDFTVNLSATTTSVTTEKAVLNSVVYTAGEKCLLDYIKHFYLNNILPDPGFMRIPLKIIPQETIDV